MVIFSFGPSVLGPGQLKVADKRNEITAVPELLRVLDLNLLKREKTKKRGIKGEQLNASRHHAYLLRLLGI